MLDIDGLVQDCSISIANALEIMQSCTKPLIYFIDNSAEQEWFAIQYTPIIMHIY